jgi:hypothetical protein
MPDLEHVVERLWPAVEDLSTSAEPLRERGFIDIPAGLCASASHGRDRIGVTFKHRQQTTSLPHASATPSRASNS